MGLSGKKLYSHIFDNVANGTFKRPIPAKKVSLADGTERLVTTVHDLMLSQYGVNRIGSDLEAIRLR